MKKLNLLLLAFLAVMGVTFQSCDDDDGYSLGDVAVDWATVNPDRWTTGYSLFQSFV